MHQAWGEAVESRKAGRGRLEAFAVNAVLSETGARPSAHAPVATLSAALLLSAFASWREHGKVNLRTFIRSDQEMPICIRAAWNLAR